MTATISGKDALTPGQYSSAEMVMMKQRAANPHRTLTYLACPYSHPNAIIRQKRFEICTMAAAWLIKRLGWNVFSPITHSHPLHVQGKCPSTWEFWEKIDREYLDVSCRLVVLCIPGWSGSTGVKEELKIADSMGLETVWLRHCPLEGDPFQIIPFDEAEDESVTMTVTEKLEPVETSNRGNFVPEGMDNPKDLIGMTKPPLRLLPGPALVKLSQVFALGAKKYGAYNWRQKAVRYTVYIEAAMRHLVSALDGEEIDPESGQSHIAHVGACAMILLDAESIGKRIDDRPTPAPTAKLIKELTETREK